MLLSLLANNNNVIPTHLPKVFVDRGGGGAAWPGYDIIDIQGALSAFTEVSGEHPVARAVRRTDHVRRHLEGLRDQRARREGAAFLAGAMLAESAAQEQIAANDAQHAVEIDRLIRVADDLRARLPMPPPTGRGAYESAGAGGIWIAAGVGLALGFLIFGNKKKGRR